MTTPGQLEGDAALLRCAEEHLSAFRDRYGQEEGVRCFFAPGRVNLMGAHLDYNGGPVMPAAVDRGTLVAVRPRADQRLRFASSSEDGGLELDLAGELPPRSGRWVDYPLGVLIELSKRPMADGVPQGVDVLFGGNLPVGAGLSSSASICVGTALALDRIWNLGRTPLELVHAALGAERSFVGVQCGIMDPYAVGLARSGHLLWLDCKDASSQHLPIDASRVTIGVADSGVRRELARGAFNQRVAECRRAFEALRVHHPADCLRDVPWEVFETHRAELDPEVARRAEHVLREVQRTFEARDALLGGDLVPLGRKMTEAHVSLRELFAVSCAELDALVDAAVECPGVLGSRLTGAGFGGCVVILLECGSEEELRRRLSASYEARFPHPLRIDFYSGGSGPREL